MYGEKCITGRQTDIQTTINTSNECGAIKKICKKKNRGVAIDELLLKRLVAWLFLVAILSETLTWGIHAD